MSSPMHQRRLAMRAVLKTYESLSEALAKAGGVNLSPSTLAEMSALELIELLAPNGIRFQFTETTNEQRTAG